MVLHDVTISPYYIVKVWYGFDPRGALSNITSIIAVSSDFVLGHVARHVWEEHAFDMCVASNLLPSSVIAKPWPDRTPFFLQGKASKSETDDLLAAGLSGGKK